MQYKLTMFILAAMLVFTPLVFATQIGLVGTDSSAFYVERTAGQTGQRNYIINDLGPELLDSQGFFVYTPHVNETACYSVRDNNNAPVAGLAAFHRSGQTFITWTETQGATSYSVNRDLCPLANSIQIVDTDSDPAPVVVRQNGPMLAGYPTSRVYTMFMDQNSWNSQVFRGQGINYAVALPPWFNGQPNDGNMTLTLFFPSAGTRYYFGNNTNPVNGRTVFVSVDDPFFTTTSGSIPDYSAYPSIGQGWNFAQPCVGTNPATAGVCNFLEAADLRIIKDVERNYPVIQSNKVYAWGHSMGGSEALALGIRYPQVFAAIYASEPMTNFSISNTGPGSDDWVTPQSDNWGTPAQNLPFHPVGLTVQYLQQFNNTSVWKMEDLQNFICQNQGRDTAIITMAHGTADNTIDTDTQGYSFYDAANRCRLGYFAVINGFAHTSTFSRGEAEVSHIGKSEPWFFTNKLESFLAFTNASGSSVPGAVGQGQFNQNLQWSTDQYASPLVNFDGPVVDTQNLYRVSIRSTDGTMTDTRASGPAAVDQTVTVTPRRFQGFVPGPPGTPIYYNYTTLDGTLLGEGIVPVDASGLVTIPNVLVKVQGTRLSIIHGAPDVVAPVISSVTTNTPSASSVSVLWSTDEIANARVDYGQIVALGTQATNASFVAAGHSVRLTGLVPQTTYYYSVTSCDLSNNCQTSNTYSFVTSLYDDSDSDGYLSNVDCNDNNAQVNPGHAEVLYNGIDDDCNVNTPDTVDADSDTYNSNVDCNDTNAAVHPGASEIPGNGIDDDCNPNTPDQLLATSTLNLSILKDVVIRQSNEINMGKSGGIYLNRGPSTDDRRILVEFEPLNLPQGAVLKDAQYSLVLYSTDNTALRQVCVFKLTQPWVEGLGTHDWDGYQGGLSGATWNQAGPNTPWSTVGGTYDPNPVTCSTVNTNVGQVTTFNLTNGIQNAPYGFILRPMDVNWRQDIFYSKDYPDTAYRPRMTVSYQQGGFPDSDQDGYSSNVDCNDNNAQVNPGHAEVLYNGIDDDCNVNTPDTVDADSDTYNSNVDCNDNNALVNPGRSEVLYNGIDDDCSAGTPDTIDADADTFNSNVDCNDNNPAINPGMSEVLYDGIDNDCNVNTPDTVDADSDTYNSNVDCNDNNAQVNPGHAEVLYNGIDDDCNVNTPDTVDADSDTYNSNVDCNDNNAAVNPGATEILYDGIDNDCNPSTPDFVDNDLDGYSDAVDCNDNNAQVNPGHAEVLYNGIDDDCNVNTPDTVDADSDSYNSNVDCNDNNAQVNPGATEVLYDGIDNDCNVNTPDTVDADSDSYTSNVDCNDNNAQVNPGHAEVLYNGIDDDCNAATQDTLDADSDGFNSNVDCNDNNAQVNPGATEVLYDGLDNDCNPQTPDSIDADQDSYGANVDCNDNNPAINPGMSEVLYDGIDNDCNAATQDTLDADSDSYNSNVDCNDNNAQVNPGHAEVLYNGIDDDCNAATQDTLDADSDTYNSNVDCNDNNAAVNPGATEIIGNGIDDDCNPATSDQPVQTLTNVSRAIVKDVVIRGSPEINMGKSGGLYINRDGSVDDRRILVEFEPLNLPQGAVLKDAEYSLVLYSAGNTAARQVCVFKLTQPWVEGLGTHDWDGYQGGLSGATWNQAGPSTPWSTAGGAFDPNPVTCSTVNTNVGQVTTFNLTNGIQNAPYGFVLRAMDVGWRQDIFYSKDYPDAAYRPKFTVTYAQ